MNSKWKYLRPEEGTLVEVRSASTQCENTVLGFSRKPEGTKCILTVASLEALVSAHFLLPEYLNEPFLFCPQRPERRWKLIATPSSHQRSPGLGPPRIHCFSLNSGQLQANHPSLQRPMTHILNDHPGLTLPVAGGTRRHAGRRAARNQRRALSEEERETGYIFCLLFVFR